MVKLKTLVKNLWKKIDFIGTCCIFLALNILLSSRPLLVTQTVNTGIDTFSNADTDTNAVDTYTPSFLSNTSAASIYIVEQFDGNNSCFIIWDFIYLLCRHNLQTYRLDLWNQRMSRATSLERRRRRGRRRRR
jgi:hypothetical protein